MSSRGQTDLRPELVISRRPVPANRVVVEVRAACTRLKAVAVGEKPQPCHGLDVEPFVAALILLALHTSDAPTWTAIGTRGAC